ncbi:MAG: hypothetical protein IJK77_02735 [Lachnospiraceae bacterium]|nr:hypothetical protein [Lachnospiraceae bacterium]
MKPEVIFEVIGYVGSAFVLASFLMASVVRLRIINSVGCIVSVVYGLLIHAYPTVIMNAALLLINIFFLIRMSKQKSADYHADRAEADDQFLHYFLTAHGVDMKKYFPVFDLIPCNYIRFAYCGDRAVGLVMGNLFEDGSLQIVLDYTTPEYRDLSVGTWLYESLAAEGIRRAVVAVPTRNHEKYMQKMGFVKEGDAWVKTLG